MGFVGVVKFYNIATIFITSAVITVSMICHAVVVVVAVVAAVTAVAAIIVVAVND